MERDLGVISENELDQRDLLLMEDYWAPYLVEHWKT